MTRGRGGGPRNLRRANREEHFGPATHGADRTDFYALSILERRYREAISPEVTLLEFIHEHRIKFLNVAGPRESEEPGIGAFVKRVLEAFP